MAIQVLDRGIGLDNPTYFIADLGANHDGDINRAIELIYRAKEAGADAAKFQNFQAPKIVSKYGFDNLGGKFSHQANWKKSVYEVYEDASVPRDWTQILKSECDKAGIHYFSSPYDFDSVDHLESYDVPAHKIGSGDITWPGIIEHIAKKGKPVFIATGASDLEDVRRAMDVILKHNKQVVLMQCNTNYTADKENFKYIHLRVFNVYKEIYPEAVLGLSDHTLGHTTVLGAVTLGARVVEKHFTDDNSRQGPDHKFAMNPITWRDMVEATRELEYSLGIPFKKIEDNERDTSIVQRRCCRAAMEIQPGTVIGHEMIEMLRPAPFNCFKPYEAGKIVGKKVTKVIPKGDFFSPENME
jgi:N-acetylneuraminate synthase